METKASYSLAGKSLEKSNIPTINVVAVEAIGKKFELINYYIENGKEIPAELTKNFVTCPLSDDPYSTLE
jgi:hypothetical protein